MKTKLCLKAFSKLTIVFCLTVLIILALHTNSAKCQQVKNGLVSYWTFDAADVDGKTVKDVWGDNNGEMIGEPTIVEGKFGDSIELHGPAANGDYIEVPTLDISPSVYPQLTMMAWIYPTSTGEGGSGNRRFIFGHDDGGWDRGILMQMSGWRTGTGNDGTDYWETGAEVDLNTWQHVAVVYDDEDIKFYKDGDEYSYGSAGEVGDGNPSLLIGAHPNMQRMFEGLIDEAYVYERTLSQDEIQQIIDSGGIATVSSLGKLAITWGRIKLTE